MTQVIRVVFSVIFDAVIVKVTGEKSQSEKESFSIKYLSERHAASQW